VALRLDIPRLTELTESTDDELVVRARDGDSRALDALLERHRRLVRAKARSYFLVGADFDDVEQEGLIGLYKAVRDFQPARGVAFRAFAELCVTRQIITAIKAASRRKHEPLNQYVSLSAGRASQDAWERTFELFVDPDGSDPADRVVSSERMAAMRNALTTMLSALEVDVLTLYMQGRSYREISEQLGRHVKSIDNALQRVKTKLESHLGSDAHEVAVA
jgi:RNA polymerase sporulation-specific sigma factor